MDIDHIFCNKCVIINQSGAILWMGLIVSKLASKILQNNITRVKLKRHRCMYMYISQVE